MKIERFIANDMRRALAKVRERQGDQAVILSSRRLPDGIEVVAAVDYDETLIRQALRGELPSQAIAPIQAPTPVPNDPAVSELRKEISAMRALIEREIGRFAEERLRGVGVRARALDDLLGHGFDADLARGIAAAIPADTTPERARGLCLALLAKSIPIPVREPIAEGGVLALVGPTGAGKTTLVAKLAARYAKTHRARDVALVALDGGRIGAREQLAGIGRSLGVPVFDTDSPEKLSELLEKLTDYPLVLIDGPDLDRRRDGVHAGFDRLGAAGKVRRYLVLPANTQGADLDETVRRHRAAAPEGAILTKLDETRRLGGALSAIVRHRLPLAYSTEGPDIFDAIEPAQAHRLVLRLAQTSARGEMPCKKENIHAAA